LQYTDYLVRFYLKLDYESVGTIQVCGGSVDNWKLFRKTQHYLNITVIAFPLLLHVDCKISSVP